MRRLILLTILLFLPACTWWGLFLGGLGVGGISTGMKSIEENKAWRDFQASPEKLYDAVTIELKKREVKLKNEPALNKEEGTAEFKGGEGYVKIYPHRKYKEYTRVEVKIGTFQTEEKFNITKEFLEDVEKHIED